MTDERDPEGQGEPGTLTETTDEQGEQGEQGEAEAPAIAALLRRSLAVDPQSLVTERKLLSGVQRKLRERSRGRFYGDGWSTLHARVNYALVALVMLLTILAVYFALGPTGIAR